MKKVEYKSYTIEVNKDEDYTLNSTDNKNTYEKTFLADENSPTFSLPFGLKYVTPLLSIRVFENKKEVSSCLLAPSHSAAFLDKNSFLIDEEKILLCCGDTVFCLSLPKLNLLWKTKADDCCCFQIFKLKDSYITHGELTVSRINESGEVLWQTGGRDIFVSIDGKDIFEIHSDHILVSDFENTVYKIDLDGNHIDEFKL